MKNLWTLLLILPGAFLWGQNTVYQENFDLPSGGDSLTQGSTNPNVSWAETGSLYFSPSQSFHLQGAKGDTAYFETNAFSTVGKPYVSLEFWHIAKTHLYNACRVKVSIDNGQTWTVVNSANYEGQSSYFGSFFTSAAYGTFWEPLNPNAAPTNNWWRREYFDLSDLASDLTNATGYPNVKIRFEAAFAAFSTIQAGWFVDNIKVKAAACEVFPPAMSFDFAPSPCYDPNPTGFQEVTTNNSYPIGVMVSDYLGGTFSGVDSVRLHYRINGGAFTTLHMATGISVDLYESAISGAGAGDTVEYFLDATDTACYNTARLPAKGYYSFEVLPTLPSKCGSTPCISSQALIRTFPWSENFDGPEWIPGQGTGTSGSAIRGGIPQFPNGGWIVTPTMSSSHGWGVSSGATNTIFTGPSGDHTSGYGKYIYTEFSHAPNGLSITTIQTPCIDLTDGVARTFSFFYHLYGKDINGLRVDIDTGSASSDWIPNYYKILGEKQTQASDEWQQAVISLAPFAGRIIKIRLTAVKVMGAADEQDIAVDDLLIRNAPPKDLSLVNILSPTSDACGPTANVPLSIEVANRGADTAYAIPVAYRLGNGPIFRDTITGVNAGLLDTVSHSFPQTLNFTPGVPYELKVWTEISGDANPEDDTLLLSLPPLGTGSISAFPYFMGFENATSSTTSNGSLNASEWVLNETSNSTGARWTVAAGKFNNFLLSPHFGLGKNHKFLLFRDETSFAGDQAIFGSRCVDLSNLVAPHLRLHYYLAPGETLKIMTSTNGQPWQVTHTLTGASGAAREFVPASVDLTAFAGQQIQIGFRKSSDGPSEDLTAAIDNISITENSTPDAALLKFPYSDFDFQLDSNFLPPVRLDASFFSVSGNIQVGVELTQKCGGSASFTGTLSMDLATWAGALPKKHYTAVLPLNGSLTAGTYECKLWISHADDSLHGNDTVYREVVVRPKVAAPYYQDFESCGRDFSTSGSNLQWEIGTPEKPGITSAVSGSQCAMTNADHNFVSNDSVEYLYSPTIQGLDTLEGAEIRFRQNFRFGHNGFGIVQILKDGNWQNLMDPTLFGTNWWSKTTIRNGLRVFSGNSGGWIYSTYPLEGINGDVAFRFAAKTSVPATTGWAIDNFAVYVPPQHSAAAENLVFPNGLVRTGSNDISLRVTNTGLKPLASVEVTVYLNGNLLSTETKNINPLAQGQSTELPLQNALNLTPGQADLMLVTSRPNSRNDAYPEDDTVKLRINLPGTIASLPFCHEFESNSAFLSFDLKGNTVNDFWQNAAPSKSLIANAHSGTKAWVTDSAGDYSALVDEALYSPAFSIQSGQCYKLSFWHHYNTERNYDGGNVEYSLDNGASWEVLGTNGDSTWYNTPFVQSLDHTKPGFSGNSIVWVNSWFYNEYDTSGTIRFRFRFASNATGSADGWAIDDFCFEPVTGICEPTTPLPETSFAKSLSLYPNPAKDVLVVKCTAPVGEKTLLSIVDQTGKTIRKEECDIGPSGSLKLEIANLPSGLYSLKLEMKEETTVKVFVKM